MRLGLQVNRFDFVEEPAAIGAAVAGAARRAEAAGLDSFWVMDHFFQIPPGGPAEQPMLEGYTALAFAAAVTERLKLGTLVTGVTYRHPGVLVKTATTLDVLSGGRAYLGIGAAWFEREHAGLGVPFPPLKERFELLEDTLRLAKQMWAGEVGPFDGTHIHLAETLCRPLPASRPHPPIMIGGGGERKTLRFVARYGDACNIIAPPGTAENVAHKLEVLRGHCETEGRAYDEIEKTTTSRFGILRREREDGTLHPDDAIAHLRALAALGVDHHIFSLADPSDERSWEIVERDILPAARELGR